MEEGIRVTTLERTIFDLAAELDHRQLERAVVAAERRGGLRWSRLREVLEEGRGKMGVSRLRSVLQAADPRAVDTRSGLEVDFLGICRRAGLPQPSINVLVEELLVDFLWPAERLIVEVDSYRYHGDRTAFERDHRATVVLEAAGYRVHRITDQMLSLDPGPFIELLRACLSHGSS